MPQAVADEVFTALADPTRRALLEALSRGAPETSSRLAADLPITRQAVEKHLAVLGRAGLVERTRAGREARYEITPAPLADAASWIAAVGGEWDDTLARLARAVERRR
ncbi:MAG: ArsR/SmtB family transcription factor [Thermoleophilaceae bacterium]